MVLCITSNDHPATTAAMRVIAERDYPGAPVEVLNGQLIPAREAPAVVGVDAVLICNAFARLIQLYRRAGAAVTVVSDRDHVAKRCVQANSTPPVAAEPDILAMLALTIATLDEKRAVRVIEHCSDDIVLAAVASAERQRRQPRAAVLTAIGSVA